MPSSHVTFLVLANSNIYNIEAIHDDVVDDDIDECMCIADRLCVMQ